MRNAGAGAAGFFSNLLKGFVADETNGFTYAGGKRAVTQSEIKGAAEKESLTSLLNYRTYDPARKLYHNADSVGFVVYAAPAAGLSEEQLRTLEGIFTGTYRPGTIIQVSLMADPNVGDILDRWAGARGANKDIPNREVFHELAGRRVSFLENATWKSLFNDEYVLIRDYHLLISVCLPLKKGQEELSRVELDELVRQQDAIIGVLRSAGMLGESVPPDFLINKIGDLFRPILNATQRREPVSYDPQLAINEQMVSDESALYDGRDGMSLKWRDNYVSILPYSVKQYPPHWVGAANGELTGSFFNRVQRLACPFMITLLVHVPDQVTAAGAAKQKLLRATQMTESPIGRYVPAWKERRRDWEYVVGRMDQGSKLLQITTNIILFAPQGTEEECEQSLKNVYASIGWRLTKTRFAVKARLLTSLPMNVGREAFALISKIKFFRSQLSWNCVNLAPWVSEWKGNVSLKDQPQLVLVGRRGQVFFVDPFLNTKGNFNMAVTAASGAGKSFFTQEYVTGLLGTGGRTFIIDSGRSYKNLCDILGGAFITFEPGSKVCLNPFSTILDEANTPPEKFMESPQKFSDQLPLLKVLIATMADPNQPINSEQMSLLESAIIEAWGSKKNQATITTVAEFLDKSSHPESLRLATMLRPYCAGGSCGEYFEGEANIDFTNYFIVLELDDLQAKGDLQTVVLMLLMKRITEVMYLSDRKQRKVCIIDEAWRLLGKGNAGAFIEEGYRTARKYGGAFMTITQGLPDYFKSPTATAAYMNSDFQFLLRQKPESLAEAKKKDLLVMEDHMEKILSSITTIGGKYSEIAVKTPDGMAVGLLLVDPAVGKLMSTRAEDVENIKALERQGKTKMEAIDIIVSAGA
jgi:conjugal transfer ATP-binding protein TraC